MYVGIYLLIFVQLNLIYRTIEIDFGMRILSIRTMYNVVVLGTTSVDVWDI